MSDRGLPENVDSVDTERQRWDTDQTVRDRVYETAIQLYESATVEEVAERAHCSDGAAREHLTWFAERGIVEVVDGRPKQYKRNQAYFDWKRANDLRREHTDTELGARLEELAEREQAYRERYEATSPQAVDLTEDVTYDAFHDAWADLSDWKTLRREMRLIERARKDREALAEASG